MLSACAVCVLVGGGGELKAQGLPKVKPGAYHSEGMTISHRLGLPSLIGSTSSNGIAMVGALDASGEAFDLDYGLVGYSVGVKIPFPKMRSQLIPSVGFEIGLPSEGSGAINDGTLGNTSTRIELAVEWRVFPFEHAKDKRYDWTKPWVGVGANLGYRPFNSSINLTLGIFEDDEVYVYNSSHYGPFLKIGVGFVAVFAEVGLSTVYSGDLIDMWSESGGDEFGQSLRNFRYGFVLEF